MLHNHHCPAGPATPDSEHTGEKNSCAKQRKCLFQKGHGNETVGQGFQQLQLIHSESAKVLGLTYQLWHNYELQPDYSNRDYLNLHLQAHAVAFHVHFSIFFPQFHIKDIQFHLHNIRAVWPRGSYATFFFFQFLYAYFEEVSLMPSSSTVQAMPLPLQFFFFFFFKDLAVI